MWILYVLAFLWIITTFIWDLCAKMDDNAFFLYLHTFLTKKSISNGRPFLLLEAACIPWFMAPFF